MCKEIQSRQNSPTILNAWHESLPSVTIAIPAYNEAAYIEKVIYTFLNNSYTNIIEILIADGGSTDGTVEMVRVWMKKDKRIGLLHNPNRIQSAALNQMLATAHGELFLRADAHCDYPDDYVETCVKVFLKTGAVNVGGAQRFVATNAVQLGIALASRSPLGSGGAKYRNPKYDGYADTVFLGCFVRSRLEQLGGFTTNKGPNEDAELNVRLARTFDVGMITNQDAELNMRLNREWKTGVYVSSMIRVWYYPRRNWRALFLQYWRYGRGRACTALRHGLKKSFRGTIPFFGLVICMIAALAAIVLDKSCWVLTAAGAMLVLYLVAAIVSCIYNRKQIIGEIWRGKVSELPSPPRQVLLCQSVMIIMGISHALGFGYQVTRILRKREITW
jgi:succinoglycan biosynthesis protein ExoA